jgi:hypothetical protein
LNMKIFFFQAIEGIKTLKIEGIKYNVGGHWNIHWDVVGFKVENILYLYFL